MSRYVVCRLLLVVLACAAVAQDISAEEPSAGGRFEALRESVLRANFLVEPPNIVAPTMGGTQLWGDELYCGAWRIQRHVMTGHYRLLDPDDIRHAWGTFDVCQRHLAELRRTGRVVPMAGPVVIVLHGLAGYRQQMAPLAEYIADHGGYGVVNVAYPSTRAGVAEHAVALRAIVANLDTANEIHFVAHSLGNLVVRHYLADYAADHGGRIDPRIHRIVMLGPPNRGSRLAEMLGGNVIFDNTLGLSATALGKRWRELEPRLGTPRCEFGIVAGGKGNGTGFNLLLPGDDDGTVCVSETRLAGASDFTLIDSLHSSLMGSSNVQEQTLRYLRTGSFHADGVRRPIAAD